ncbi:MAG TPA: nitronate monooxygenase, partial [Gaiellaceae bacterium]|nr:nitronate monooxygenase [Gaiellaceae bacterium]
MIRTPACEVLGVDVPIVQGSFGPWTNAELSAAVSVAGGLGSVGTALLDASRVRELIRSVRELTDRPFAVNFTARPLVDEVFEAVLEEAPAVVSYALGDPGELPARVHGTGAVFVQQVHTVGQARTAADRGVDVLIAQGSEAGGFGGTVGAFALLPQVVDAVAPLPVLASGGIADGRGLAAALLLGAQGANIGTRFLASTEAGIADSWKEHIVGAESEDAVKVEFADAVFPPAPASGYAVRPRVLRTPFVDAWNVKPEEARAAAGQLQAELAGAIAAGRAHELFPFTGQTVGLIDEVLPVAEIVRRIVSDAEAALRRAATLV